jgi:site-specific DNA-methyltransferase (cytosine-N4-specific)
VIVRGDARHLPIATGTVDCVVTSPPYLKQRVYGTSELEGGREDTLAAYIAMICAVFDELRRVMKPDTSHAWLNIGDKANNSGGAGGDWAKANKPASAAGGGPGRFRDPAFAEASYLDVPGAVVAALMARGWRLRLPIVWDKGRQSPEDLRHVRRPRWQHEMIYLLTPWERARRATEIRPRWYPSALAETGSVWHFPPGGKGDPHLAPFPDELARRCILPTTLPGDVVLDPFAGSGTVPRVARQLGRVGIGVELYAGRPDLITGTGRRADVRAEAAG